MSLHGSFLSDDQFLCSICLDVFTNPSSTPCGHSFCMTCISKYWDGATVCQCPLCKKTFQNRPDLQINRTLREITEQFRSMRGTDGGEEAGRSRRGATGGAEGDVDVSPRAQPVGSSPSSPSSPPALASSVPSTSPLSSMAQSQPRSPSSTVPSAPSPGRSSTRRRFTVSGVANSHRVPLCERHHCAIVLYCRDDQMCICPECKAQDHQSHNTMNIEALWMENKAQLSVSEQQIQEMIRERLWKVQEIRTAVNQLEMAVEQETTGSVYMFTALTSALEHSQAELLEVMEMSRRAVQHHAENLIRQLEYEMDQLRMRGHALAELARSDDHIHCVKSFPAVSTLPPTKDWSGVSVKTDLGTKGTYRSLVTVLERFQEQLRRCAVSDCVNVNSDSSCFYSGSPAFEMETSLVRAQPRPKRIQEYAMNVTLDSKTAHPRLILSEDLKSVKCGDRHQPLPDNPERFNRVVCVLGREPISSGRHYWEVDVGGKTDWDLGVASKSVNRKGKVEVTPSNGYWFLSLREKNKSSIRSEPSSDTHHNLHPNKIGIFVDYTKGQVSFYNVDAKIHIYSFYDTFTENILPFFSPCTNKSGKNYGPLFITPVNGEQ